MHTLYLLFKIKIKRVPIRGRVLQVLERTMDEGGWLKDTVG